MYMLELIMQLTTDSNNILCPEHMTANSCGYYLRRLRESSGVSQTELADTAMLSTSYISHLEDGTSISSISTTNNICKALKVPPHTLYEAAIWLNQI
jgi:transcriptional regulator with XRE-family HTH domain